MTLTSRPLAGARVTVNFIVPGSSARGVADRELRVVVVVADRAGGRPHDRVVVCSGARASSSRRARRAVSPFTLIVIGTFVAVVVLFAGKIFDPPARRSRRRRRRSPSTVRKLKVNAGWGAASVASKTRSVSTRVPFQHRRAIQRRDRRRVVVRDRDLAAHVRSRPGVGGSCQRRPRTSRRPRRACPLDLDDHRLADVCPARNVVAGLSLVVGAFGRRARRGRVRHGDRLPARGRERDGDRGVHCSGVPFGHGGVADDRVTDTSGSSSVIVVVAVAVVIVAPLRAREGDREGLVDLVERVLDGSGRRRTSTRVTGRPRELAALGVVVRGRPRGRCAVGRRVVDGDAGRRLPGDRDGVRRSDGLFRDRWRPADRERRRRVVVDDRRRRRSPHRSSRSGPRE